MNHSFKWVFENGNQAYHSLFLPSDNDWLSSSIKGEALIVCISCFLVATDATDLSKCTCDTDTDTDAPSNAYCEVHGKNPDYRLGNSKIFSIPHKQGFGFHVRSLGILSVVKVIQNLPRCCCLSRLRFHRGPIICTFTLNFIACLLCCPKTQYTVEAWYKGR